MRVRRPLRSTPVGLANSALASSDWVPATTAGSSERTTLRAMGLLVAGSMRITGWPTRRRSENTAGTSTRATSSSLRMILVNGAPAAITSPTLACTSPTVPVIGARRSRKPRSAFRATRFMREEM